MITINTPYNKITTLLLLFLTLTTPLSASTNNPESIIYLLSLISSRKLSFIYEISFNYINAC